MKTIKLIIQDEVNVKFEDLDAKYRRECNNKLKYMIHSARHTPAFKLGRWDGTISFFTLAGSTYLNCLEKILPYLIQNDHDIVIEDKRVKRSLTFEQIDENYIVNNCSQTKWGEGHSNEGEDILIRDYQVEAINDYLNNPHWIKPIATGAGKTIMTAVLSHNLEKYGRSIVIVPSTDLVTQTEEDYKNIGLDVGVYYGKRKELDKTHTICTWQSIMVLKRNKDVESKEILQQLLDGVIGVIVDECHILKGNEVRDLLTDTFKDIPIRWGLTGTIPKEEYNKMSLQVSVGCFGDGITAFELQDREVLSNCFINILQTIDLPQYKEYSQENNYLLTNKERVKWLSDTIQEVSKTGNTLVLVSKIDIGTRLQGHIPNSTFIQGRTKSNDRKDEYKDINTEDNKVLIATYGVASTGINIPRLFNVILVESGKSFVRVIQSIGRGLRKANDKNRVTIYDICSTAKFSKAHLLQRKKYYAEAKYNFNQTKITYDEQITIGKNK